MTNSPTPEQLKQAAHKANQMQREVMGLSNLDELREKLQEMFYGVAMGADEEKACSDAMLLISQYTQQETLKASIDTITYIDSMLRFENIPLHMVQAESLKVYLRQLEAQLTTNKSKEK